MHAREHRALKWLRGVRYGSANDDPSLGLAWGLANFLNFRPQETTGNTQKPSKAVCADTRVIACSASSASSAQGSIGSKTDVTASGRGKPLSTLTDGISPAFGTAIAISIPAHFRLVGLAITFVDGLLVALGAEPCEKRTYLDFQA